MSQASPATSSELDQLPSQLQQALQSLDLEPEQELEKYRQYKNGGIAALLTEPERPVIDTTDEEDEEEYELIPPSQPFAMRDDDEEDGVLLPEMEPIRYQVPGELVLSSHLREDESLDLSFLTPPGEITQLGDEYRPASQELWRSLGQPEPPPAPAPEAKWRLPVAIGSSLLAVATVAGMTYVNTHAELLKTIPVVAQLTAAPIPNPIPPGNLMQGPDLAMGEFSNLTLANINGIALPTTAAPIEAPTTIAAAPNTAPVLPSTAPVVLPSTAPTVLPSTAPVTGTPGTANTPSLADSLIRNLLPPNIQQLSGRSAAPAQPQSAPKSAVKAYTPSQMLFQPSGGESVKVVADYVGPVVLAKILSVAPQATVEGDKVNLGSFANQSQARKIIASLAKQGIKARLK
jgi:hypothetical protein